MALCNIGKDKRCKRCGTQYPPATPDDAFAVCNRKGLGDYVATVASALGIKAKRGCGCAERQKRLNKWF